MSSTLHDRYDLPLATTSLAAELAMYEQTKARVLTPDCTRWLELERAGFMWLCTSGGTIFILPVRL